MADDDNNLVSQVTVQGTDEAAAQLDAYATSGAASFDKLNQSAAKSAAGINASTDAVADSAGEAADALEKVGEVKVDPAVAKNLDAIQKSTSDLVTEARKGIKDLADFAARVIAIGTGAIAAGAGLLVFAASIAKQAQGTSDALDKQTASQIDANNAALAATTASINYQSSQAKLANQLQQGTITYTQYSAALVSLNQDYRDQQVQAAKVAAAQQEVKDENDALTKSLANRKVYDDLIATYGGPLLTSLISLGNEVTAIKGQFVDAFGPAVSGLLDAINDTLVKNGSSIKNFFDSAAKSISDFVSKNTPAVQKALESLGKIMSSVFQGVIDALPVLLDLFNNKLVPAINAVGDALTTVADLFNKAFGTNVTGGVIAIVAALTFMTGGFKLALAAVKLFLTGIGLLSEVFAAFGLAISPVAIAIAALGLILAATQVDWSRLWSNSATEAQNASQSIVSAWQSVSDFFTALPATIGGFFTSLWASVQSGYQTAIASLLAAWQAVVNFFSTLPAIIGGYIQSIWDGAVSAVAIATQAVEDAWNGLVTFFTTLPAQLSAIWDTITLGITTAFSNAVTSVKNYFAGLAQSALQYLKPIVDMLNQIMTLSASADSGGSSAPAFAGGGSVWSKRGQVKGPGTSTSDSIAAWLSNNEFVVQARAVKKYGTDFLHAVNSGRLDPSKILGFASGGLVGSFTQPRLAFAASAPAAASTAAGRILNLKIGDQSFDNLLMPDDVADRMERYAVGQQSRSAGRKPSWVGGTK